ncbi:MAG: peptidoglycan DD-metalloendopeptidase family protein [Alphaproteobacteria bacterium]|nr:peptidoglycan DD-metalloendopeptidase family protein [Alphaproteobacteria bacterium]
MSRRSKLWNAVSAAAVIAFLCAGPLARAQKAETTDPLEKLDAIEKQLGSDRRSIESLTDSAAQQAEEQRTLRDKLIQAAATAQARERDLNVVEQRLALFETREASAMRALVDQRGKLSSLLAVLQRMGSEPPPALIVQPNDATAAARSAMLLSAVVPAVQKEAAKLGKDLSELRQLRQNAADERLKVAAAAAALDKDRNMLSELLIQRRSAAAQTDQELKDAQARANDLAEQAGDLRALIASLNEDARRPSSSTASQVITKQIASAGAARTMSLDGLKGMLTLPANGELKARFGSEDGDGGHLAGIRLETRPGSAVTSPCDGKIMFAGTFRGYGQMLIISANGGYHVLLAGLAKIDGVVGQTVLAGEPVGRMGAGRRPQHKSVQTGSGGERLYIEFRRNGVPVDPAPWFAGLKDKVSG